METPIQTAGQGLVRAYLEIIAPENVPVPLIPLRFNPTEYQLQKTNNFAEIPIPGLGSSPIQFVRGVCEKLSAELIADTSDTLEDVRLKYTNGLRELMDVNPDLHAPPIVRLIWDDQIFKGVVESLNISYTVFSPEGVPWRAKLNIVLKEYLPVEEQVSGFPTSSPDVDKFHTLVRGETLASVAWKAFGDPTQWREIARHNDIDDPRGVAPGTVLNIPRLR